MESSSIIALVAQLHKDNAWGFKSLLTLTNDCLFGGNSNLLLQSPFNAASIFFIYSILTCLALSFIDVYD